MKNSAVSIPVIVSIICVLYFFIMPIVLLPSALPTNVPDFFSYIINAMFVHYAIGSVYIVIPIALFIYERMSRNPEVKRGFKTAAVLSVLIWFVFFVLVTIV